MNIEDRSLKFSFQNRHFQHFFPENHFQLRMAWKGNFEGEKFSWEMDSKRYGSKNYELSPNKFK